MTSFACHVCALIGPTRYCPDHQPNRRSPSSRATSTTAWKALRAQVLSHRRWRCQICGAPAIEVHHKVPVARGGPKLPTNRHELAALCHDCHRAAHRPGGGLPRGVFTPSGERSRAPMLRSGGGSTP